MSLEPKDRRYLKSLAHHLDPIVRVGKGRLSSELVIETSRSLEAHELIKARLDVEDGEERRDLAARLAQKAGAELVGTIGKIAILYRERSDNPKIRLPRK